MKLSKLIKTAATGLRLKAITYDIEGHVAKITLNRPERLNAISESTPDEIKLCVERANAEPAVKANTCYQTLWHSLKPTVAQINGDCIAGGTDIALACDVTFMADEARIGYPPTRVWGCPTGAMWIYRLGSLLAILNSFVIADGAEKAKRLLLTGELINGQKAAEIGLIGESCKGEELEKTVQKFVEKLRGVPTNQLFFQKMVVNNAVDMLGLGTSQKLATLLDGMSRHTPEGVQFQKIAQTHGFKYAIAQRDSHGESFEC